MQADSENMAESRYNMSFAKKHNKGNRLFDIDVKDFKFKKLSEIGTDPIKIDGLYINRKSEFGNHPVAIVCDKKILIDLPNHMTQEVEDILTDTEDIEAIKNGEVGIIAENYTSKKYKKECVGVSFVDIVNG